jgi:hypothetical protein
LAGDLSISWPRAIGILIMVAGLCFLLGVMMTHWDRRGRNIDVEHSTWTATEEEDDEDR